MCLGFVALASWAVKTSDLHSPDAWKIGNASQGSCVGRNEIWGGGGRTKAMLGRLVMLPRAPVWGEMRFGVGVGGPKLKRLPRNADQLVPQLK
uniref:Secreted protein n=1 Tax=Laticauda laticaudata TaxID=8630 RepID=A0A8C5S2Y2_LATLA